MPTYNEHAVEDMELRVRWCGQRALWSFHAIVHAVSDDSDPGDMPEGLNTMGYRESMESALWVGLRALQRNIDLIERGKK